MENLQIRAVVKCTIEVPVGVWGGGMTDMDKLTEQVRQEGKDIVSRMVRDANGCILGDLRVSYVILEEDKK